MNGPDPPAERRVTGRVDEKRTNAPPSLIVVQNWFEELRWLVPTP